MADKDQDGLISHKELKIVITDYGEYLKAQEDIVHIVKQFDANGDRILDKAEMLRLLQANHSYTT